MTFGGERTQWWAAAIEVWRDYDECQRSTDRAILLFVLEPMD